MPRYDWRILTNDPSSRFGLSKVRACRPHTCDLSPRDYIIVFALMQIMVVDTAQTSGILYVGF